MPSLKVWTVLILYVVSTYFRRSITAQGYGFHSQRSSDLGDHHGHEHEHHHHEHDHHLSGRHHHHDDVKDRVTKLPAALPEEEHLKSIDFSADHNNLHHRQGVDHNLNEGPISGFGFLKDGIVVMHLMVVLVLISTYYEGLWVRAMGCSFVNMSSLIRLILLPVFFLQGKTSKMMVDSSSLFGDEAILRDAFLHQFPRALGIYCRWFHLHCCNRSAPRS